MNRTRILSAIALAVALTACGDAGNDVTGPEGPSMNGGLVAGGNRSDSTTVPQSEPEDDDTGGLVTGGN